MSRHQIISDFARTLLASPEVELEVQPLRGGLQAEGISLIHARRGCDAETTSFVVKPMSGTAVREYRVHAAVQQSGSVAAPRILGCVDSASDSCAYLFMEWVPAATAWPWDQHAHAAEVLRQLARLHEWDVCSFSPVISDWDYDAELACSAESTVELYRSLFRSGFRVWQRPMIRPLERVARSVTALRRQAMEFTGAALLHGDTHPGNAVIRDRNGALQAVLLDWGRARLGSPLEDIMSWVHSLGFWERNARQTHDTLLLEYRRAAGLSDSLPSSFRSVAWMAGACNAMAGALRYHLAVAADPNQDDGSRRTASAAAADWLRIVRRADAICRS